MIRCATVSQANSAETIGARLKRLRLQRGLSQRDLSSPGVSYAYISRIEAGARTPSVKALRKLSQKLGVTVEYLETGRDIREVDDRELRLADAELELRLSEDFSEAERNLEAILQEATTAGDVSSATRARVALGLAAAQRGEHLAAVERLEAALNEHAVPAPHRRPDLYTTLGQSYAALGAADRAVRIFEDCLARVREDVPEDRGIAIRYATFLSYALTDAGDYDRAATVVRDALALAEDQTDPYTRVRLYWSLGRLRVIEGNSSEALEYIRNAIALLKATDDSSRSRGASARSRCRTAQQICRRGAAKSRPRRAAARRQPEHRRPRHAAHRRVAVRGARGRRGSSRRTGRDALALLATFHGEEQGYAVRALANGLALQGDEGRRRGRLPACGRPSHRPHASRRCRRGGARVGELPASAAARTRPSPSFAAHTISA